MSTQSENIWTGRFIMLVLSSFTLFMSFQMLLPIVPKYAKETGGAGITIGLVAAAVSLSAIVMRFYFLKKMNPRMHAWLYRLAQLLLIIVFVLYSLVHDPLSLMLIRFLHGLSWGVLTTLNGNYVGKALPQQKKGEGFGYFNFGVTLALAIGPFLSLHLSSTFSFQTLSQIAGVFALISILLSVSATKEVAPDSTVSASSQVPLLNQRLSWKKLLVPIITILLVTIPYSGLTGFLTLFQQARHLGDLSFFFVINAIFGFVVQLFVGRLSDAKSLRFVLIPAGCSLFLGLLLVQLTTTETQFFVYVGAAFFGLGFGSCTPLIQSWFNKLFPHNMAHVANFAYYNSFDMGMLLGSVIFGVLPAFSGYGNIYGVALLFIALMILLLFFTRSKKKHIVKS
ncbi:major facilitator superfamily transporter [Listeria grayi]|uniref:MFS transporter n=2 Tax=Listeria grayi TaxID=1641 RepID=UPI000F6DC1E7|nr:MFS transporter [Listeria grayi]VEI36754.1 major facilitator superfamily transporter [Listeria grayi]